MAFRESSSEASRNQGAEPIFRRKRRKKTKGPLACVHLSLLKATQTSQRLELGLVLLRGGIETELGFRSSNSILADITVTTTHELLHRVLRTRHKKEHVAPYLHPMGWPAITARTHVPQKYAHRKVSKLISSTRRFLLHHVRPNTSPSKIDGSESAFSFLQ